MIIELKGNPISTNSMFSGRRFLTPAAKSLKEDFGWQVKSQWRQKPMKGRLKMSVGVYFGSKRARDLDNLKMVYDALTGIVYEDDSQIDELYIFRYYDKENPRIILDIQEI